MLINPTFSWCDTSGSLSVCDREVHLWRIVLDAAVSHLHYLNEILSQDEIQRAQRFYFERDKINFAVTRGLLRIILGRYLAIEPREISFIYNTYGKPLLNPEKCAKTLQFNVSHADSLAFIGLTCDRRIGVDIEKMKANVQIDLIADQYFTLQEVKKLKKIAGDKRLRTLWDFWTCKEAFVKAIGKGLSFPFNQFDISDAIEGSICLAGQLPEAYRWSIVKFNPSPNYVGTLVVEGEVEKVICWNVKEVSPELSF